MDKETKKRFRKMLFEIVFSLRHNQWGIFERASVKFCKEFFRWRDIEWPKEMEEKKESLRKNAKNVEKSGQ